MAIQGESIRVGTNEKVALEEGGHSNSNFGNVTLHFWT